MPIAISADRRAWAGASAAARRPWRVPERRADKLFTARGA
jgi:hypothetical protein